MWGRLGMLLMILIVVAFFSEMSVAEFGALVGNGIQSIFTFLGNLISSATQ